MRQRNFPFSEERLFFFCGSLGRENIQKGRVCVFTPCLEMASVRVCRGVLLFCILGDFSGKFLEGLSLERKFLGGLTLKLERID